MTALVNVAGVWKSSKGIFIRQGGSWVPVRYAYVKDGGVWKQFFSTEVVVTLSSNTNIDISSLFSAADWSNPDIMKRVIIPNGVSIGSTDVGRAALRSGGGLAGMLKIENSGTILGCGGAINGGVGGDAFLADDAGIHLINHGDIWAGGGGGGKGGQGGAGTYTATITDGPHYSGVHGSPAWFWMDSTKLEKGGTNATRISWDGSEITVSPTHASSYVNGGYTYYRGNFRERQSSQKTRVDAYEVSRSHSSTKSATGGNGGDGGRGQGYSVAYTGGSSGAAGGTNAGTGGNGGSGAAWGQSGADGSAGTDGNAGSGFAGQPGGLAGFAIKNIANVTLTNTGSWRGRT